ncbi:hypothetical protein B0H63DRAFT_88090 [Podospora didyma]|uniref:Uncharacterized protein n=1 Tax=Podospora didyma TaxID=330526 RepID=A0AAE0K0Z3_9PEZI|nr:hypothetical protein B0H63DRAFT_88090 [Podospora didyma]
MTRDYGELSLVRLLYASKSQGEAAFCDHRIFWVIADYFACQVVAFRPRRLGDMGDYLPEYSDAGDERPQSPYESDDQSLAWEADSVTELVWDDDGSDDHAGGGDGNEQEAAAAPRTAKKRQRNNPPRGAKQARRNPATPPPRTAPPKTVYTSPPKRRKRRGGPALQPHHPAIIPTQYFQDSWEYNVYGKPLLRETHEPRGHQIFLVTSDGKNYDPVDFDDAAFHLQPGYAAPAPAPTDAPPPDLPPLFSVDPDLREPRQFWGPEITEGRPSTHLLTKRYHIPPWREALYNFVSRRQIARQIAELEAKDQTPDKLARISRTQPEPCPGVPGGMVGRFASGPNLPDPRWRRPTLRGQSRWKAELDIPGGGIRFPTQEEMDS